jgi:TPP-dependent pyruvate/acetoin dehydrogenase alpha subunit
MHLFDVAQRFYGGNAIVGGGLPLAAGLALADKMQGRKRVTACFFGEGAVAEGEFHESMNLAALWKLPVLFLCENNLYAMGTALSRSESDTDLVTKAASYNMAALSVDGMDVEAVHSVTREAVDTIRRLSVPYFLELQTYRFRAHSMFDPELYRSKAEVEKWKKHCPIETFTARLRQAGFLDERQLQGLEADVAQEVGRAVAFAEAGTLEPVEDLEKDVYAR